MSTDSVTSVSFLLDETGSMESIKDDTIGGFNQYLDSLKQPDAGRVEFTLVKFDSNKIDKVYVGVPIADVQPLTKETYKPGAATPLIDASVKIIRATDEALNKRSDTPKVLIVIQTDGQENASREHSLAALQAIIKEKTAVGWQFIFLGAGIDAFSHAAAWGIPTSQSLSYQRGNSKATFTALSANTTNYRMGGTGADLSFSADQRNAAGDLHHQMPPAGMLTPNALPQDIDPLTNPRKHPTPIVDDFTLEEESQP